MKKEIRVKNPRVLTPLRKPPRLEGVVENMGIKPIKKKSKKAIQERINQIKNSR